jgi:tRNA-Thr(GGU) m(6)t(6)A37 methyltransferase TsaA
MGGWRTCHPQHHTIEQEVNEMGNQATIRETLEIFPVGYVRRKDARTCIKILEPYAPALKELEHFGHVQVLWWFGQFQDEMYREITQGEPPYDAPVLGVFACRSPVRPNPIGLSTTKIQRVDHDAGLVEIGDIDAFDDTPVLDLKPYLPVCDRVEHVRVPEWAADWPQWMPEEGPGLEEGE